MRVKAKETCFVNGHRRRAGEIFDYDGPDARFLEAVNGEVTKIVAIDSPLTDEQIRVRLAEYGIKVAPATGRKKLLENLVEAEGTKPE